MSSAEFLLLIMFGPIAFLLIGFGSAWLNGQSFSEWFRIQILKKRR